MGVGDDENGKGHEQQSEGEEESSSRGVLRLIGDSGKSGVSGAFEDGGVEEKTNGAKPYNRGDALVRGADGEAVPDEGDARRTRALRRYVCHVLGVDVETEGEALVSNANAEGVGSTAMSRIDWARVGAITEGLAQKKEPVMMADGGGGQDFAKVGGGDGGATNDPITAADATTASPDTSGHTPTAMDTGDAAGAPDQPAAAATAGAQSTSIAQPATDDANDSDMTAKRKDPSPFAGPERSMFTTGGVAGSAVRGKIGPPRVEVDRAHVAGDVRLDDETGTFVTSLSNFSSVRANACVFAGKWVYEATLGSSGIMQLGWATIRCPFTHEHGVGDAQDSYAYDGHRVRKWNVSCHPYGEAIPSPPSLAKLARSAKIRKAPRRRRVEGNAINARAEHIARKRASRKKKKKTLPLPLPPSPNTLFDVRTNARDDERGAVSS